MVLVRKNNRLPGESPLAGASNAESISISLQNQWNPFDVILTIAVAYYDYIL